MQIHCFAYEDEQGVHVWLSRESGEGFHVDDERKDLTVPSENVTFRRGSGTWVSARMRVTPLGFTSHKSGVRFKYDTVDGKTVEGTVSFDNYHVIVEPEDADVLPCARCRGSKQEPDGRRCARCGGTGAEPPAARPVFSSPPVL